MKTVKELCRELRKNQTPAEKVLWQLLRNRKLDGHKFLRQYPIAVQSVQGKLVFYIADFYCASERLVVEADGPIHELKKEYNKNRDLVMNTLGLKVLRFKNEKILNNAENVLKEIIDEIAKPAYR